MQHPPKQTTPGGAVEADETYFARRAEEEEQAAARASNEAIAEVHYKLARKYAALAAAARDRETQSQARG